MLKLRLNPRANKDVDEILDWSEDRFGAEAADRYNKLILRSIKDLRSDPECLGSKTYPKLLIDSARIYPLSFSRTHVTGKPVGNPRHVILYRVVKGTLYVARVLHESSDLPRHIPKSFRR